MIPLFQRLKQLLHESEGSLLALLVALHAIAVPSTFSFLIFTAFDWTWWNCLPRIAYFTFLASAWFLYPIAAKSPVVHVGDESRDYRLTH